MWSLFSKVRDIFSHITAYFTYWDWRIVNILSNFKQDAGDDPSNYRAESLISVVENLIGKKINSIKRLDDYELIKLTQNALYMNKYLYSTTILYKNAKRTGTSCRQQTVSQTRSDMD